jgi:TRAP-type transport system periplasmic protein
MTVRDQDKAKPEQQEETMDRRDFLKTSAGVAGLALAAPHIARAATITMRFAHFAEEGHPANIAAKQFASQIEKRTDGAIKIAIFPNNQLGGPPEQAQQIKLGTIDMGLPTQGQLDKYDIAFAAVMLPFVFDNPAHV